MTGPRKRAGAGALARPRKLAPGGLTRPRRLAAAGALGLVLVVAVVLLARGGDDAAPAGAAKLVPASALVYVHVVTGSGRPGTERALRLARRFPAFARARTAAEAALGRFGRGTGVDFARDVRPWLGDEAAAALVGVSRRQAASVVVLAVSDRARAREFLQRLGRPTGLQRYRGARLELFGTQSYAFAGSWLVLGPPGAVRAALDAQAGRRPALADDPVFTRAEDGAPADRVADAYATAGGVRRLLTPRGGALGFAGAALDQPGLQGVALSLTAHDATASLRAHWALSGGPGVPGGLPLSLFGETLPHTLPGPVTALVDVAGLNRALPALVGSLLPRRLLDRLAGAGLDLGADVAPLLAGEAALAVYSRPQGPAVLLVARVRSEARAREALARLQGPLIALVAPGAEANGLSPTFTQRRLPGLTAYGLRLGPGVELDYAVGGGRIALTTDFGLLRALARTDARADEQPLFRTTVGPRPARSAAVAYADLKALLRVAEPSGLAANPRYAALAPDLRPIRAVGFRAAGGPRESSAEVTLAIP